MCDVGLSHLPKSKQALDDARSGVRSLIMFQGLNNSPFTNNLITKAEGRLKLNLTKDSIYFLYVGRLLEPKGIQYAINAIHDLRLELNLDLRMIILGEGDFKNELVKLANELSISKFINFFSSVKIEQVPLFMRSADCLILPSKSTIHEQFGRVIAEAMFSGTFVIGSTSGEIPNAIGEDGFVFIADNLQDLKIKICNFIFNKGEVENIIKNAKVNSIKKYSVNSFVEKLKSLLNELI
jgi:glycosyltransferase involved in cell wall biosynthesis